MVRYCYKVLQISALNSVKDMGLEFFFRRDVLVKYPYFLNPSLDTFDTCTVVRYWSKILPSSTCTLLSDLGVNVMALEKQGF